MKIFKIASLKSFCLLGLLSLISAHSAVAIDRIDPQVNLNIGRTFYQFSANPAAPDGYVYYGVKVTYFNYRIANEIALNTAGLGLGLTSQGNANLLFSPVGISYMNWLGFALDYSYVPTNKSSDLGLSFNFNLLHLINR